MSSPRKNSKISAGDKPLTTRKKVVQRARERREAREIEEALAEEKKVEKALAEARAAQARAAKAKKAEVPKPKGRVIRKGKSEKYNTYEDDWDYKNFRSGTGLADDSDEEKYVGGVLLHKNSRFNADFIRQGKMLAQHGLTDSEIAEFFGIGDTTLNRWMVKYPEFSEALKLSREKPDQRVVKSLYHRAVGYSYDAVKVFMPSGAKEPVYATYREHVPPDITACIFWLKNRDRENWRDRWEVTGANGTPLVAGNNDVALAIMGLLKGAGQLDGGTAIPVSNDVKQIETTAKEKCPEEVE